MICTINYKNKAKSKYLCNRCNRIITAPKRISVDSKLNWHLCNSCFQKLKLFMNGHSAEFLNKKVKEEITEEKI